MEQNKSELKAEHARLLQEIEEASKPQDFGSDVDGSNMDEETSEGEATANRLALVQALKDRVNEIEEALRGLE